MWTAQFGASRSHFKFLASDIFQTRLVTSFPSTDLFKPSPTQ